MSESSEKPFKIGDVVKVKGQSVPIMTVKEVGDDYADVVWFNKTTMVFHQDDFLFECLVKHDPNGAEVEV